MNNFLRQLRSVPRREIMQGVALVLVFIFCAWTGSMLMMAAMATYSVEMVAVHMVAAAALAGFVYACRDER